MRPGSVSMQSRYRELYAGVESEAKREKNLIQPDLGYISSTSVRVLNQLSTEDQIRSALALSDVHSHATRKYIPR